MVSSTSTPLATWTAVPSRKATLGATPAATISRSHSSWSPWSRSRSTDYSGLFRYDRRRLWSHTRTPCFSTQRLIMLPASGVIMRGTMRSPISTTVRCTPRLTSASMMMQPINPAPSCSTREPGWPGQQWPGHLPASSRFALPADRYRESAGAPGVNRSQSAAGRNFQSDRPQTKLCVFQR
jgi:hypothetical protein